MLCFSPYEASALIGQSDWLTLKIKLNADWLRQESKQNFENSTSKICDFPVDPQHNFLRGNRKSTEEYPV